MIGGPAKAAKAFEDARRHVSGGRIDHGVVIGERNVAENLFVVVAVEGAPAAIAILHAKQPLNPAADGGFHALGLREFHALQSHEDKGGVVDIGIKIIAEFEDPAAGISVFILDLPVAGAKDLLGQNPIRALDK